MTRTSVRRLAGAAALAAFTTLLAACDSPRETFGFDRSVPDEFSVMSRAPLQIPPTLSELPPPQPGAPRPQETPTREQAEAIVFGQGVAVEQPGGAVSRGEYAFLEQAGATTVDGNIRRTVDEEATAAVIQDDRFIDTLLFWQTQPISPGTVVDPYQESQRLAANAEAGRPLAEGETAIIIRRRRAPFEGLFD